jgi:hypothetical protein
MRPMFRHFFVFSLAAAASLASCSKSTKQEAPARDSLGFHTTSSAYVREDKGSWTYVTENGSFHYKEVLGDKGTYEAALLLEEKYHNENTPVIEGMRGDATVTAWTMTNPRDRELRWTAREKANEGEVRDLFFRFTAWGCCDSPNTYTYYNLLSGKKMYVTNSDLLEVRGKGEGPLSARFVGFGYDVVNNHGHDPVLQYGTYKDISQKISIHSGKDYYELPDMLGDANGKSEKYHLDLTNSPFTFVIVMRYSAKVEIRIPVEDDEIRLEKAVLPAGYSFRPEN